MYKVNDNFSFEQRFVMVMQGVSFAMYEAIRDRNNFDKYKNDNVNDFSVDTIRDMNILSLLEKLGYPMDELGTYLYKDVIVEVYEYLKDGKKSDDLMFRLNNIFSDLYHYVAREWKEMGVKSFHFCIQDAIRKIDYNLVDNDLSKSIYGESYNEDNYGVYAFNIANYLVKEYCLNNTNKLVKKLSNVS